MYQLHVILWNKFYFIDLVSEISISIIDRQMVPLFHIQSYPSYHEWRRILFNKKNYFINGGTLRIRVL